MSLIPQSGVGNFRFDNSNHRIERPIEEAIAFELSLTPQGVSKTICSGPVLPPALPNGIFYNTTDNIIYWSDGTNWFPTSSSGGSDVRNFSYNITGPINVPSGTFTVLTNLNLNLNGIAQPEIDQLSGIITAAATIDLELDVFVDWQGNTANYGERILTFQTRPAGGGSGSWVNHLSLGNEADLCMDYSTSQNLSSTIRLTPGQQVRVIVEHTTTSTQSLLTGENFRFHGTITTI